ncbi:MAG: hypothetical protein H7174_00070 [Flavobacterium sp.]|nr:hypothetical protein [Flavobacterium sp.]
MKKLLFIIILLISFKTLAQDHIVKDTLFFKLRKFDITHIDYGKHSSERPMILLTCNNNNYQKMQSSIVKCFKKYKVEFTDFYILCIEKNNSNYYAVVRSFIKKINIERTKNNLDLYNVDETNLNKKKYTPADDFFKNVNYKEICYYLTGNK